MSSRLEELKNLLDDSEVYVDPRAIQAEIDKIISDNEKEQK